MKPVLHRIFVLPDLIEEQDETIKRARAVGIHVELDKREKDAVTMGIVKAIGSTSYIGFDTTAEQQGIAVGSHVMYAKYSGAKVPNSDLIILNDEDVLGVDE